MNRYDRFDFNVFWIGLITGATVTMILFYCIKNSQIKALKSTAIKHGYAHMVIVDPFKGKTEFQWVESEPTDDE